MNSRLFVPSFKKILGISNDVVRENIYSRVIGLDFAVTSSNEIKLIEINNKNNEINFYQMSNGPLFESFTDEIINYCKNKKCSFNLGFDI